jgi:HlyD family secretion protein
MGGGLAIFLHGAHKATVNAAEAEGDEPREAEIPVKIVAPRFDGSFTMTEKRPADVRPYFEAGLETRVPGIVLPFSIDVGSKVQEGEKLLEVSVPDLKARVTQRQADLELAKAQVTQKEAAIETAEAQLTAAEAKVELSDARLRSNIAFQKFRDKQEKRYTNLLAERAIDARLVDEQEDRLQASIEAVNAAKEAVAYAKAEVKAAKARITQAKADLEEAKKNVDAQQAELGYAEAMLGYSIIRAPFDGVIVRREADPGDFVQNAGTGHATPLLTIQRNDIVTVVVRVPDNYAAYITPNTEAIFETPSLPGVKIHGKVTVRRENEG